MKKYFTIFMSLVLVVSGLLVTPAKAETTSKAIDCTETVYHVDSYEELKAAFEEGTTDRTIILEKDIYAGADLDYRITVDGDDTIVFDMNGYSYDVVSSYTTDMFVFRGTNDVYFINSNLEMASWIDYNLCFYNKYQTAIINLNMSEGGSFTNYNVNMCVGDSDYSEYIDSYGGSKDYIDKETAPGMDVDVFFLGDQAKGTVNLLGGRYLNYYYNGTILYGEYLDYDQINLANVDFKSGYSNICIDYMTRYTDFNIFDGTFVTLDPSVPTIQDPSDPSTTFSEILGNNLVYNDRAVVDYLNIGASIDSGAKINECEEKLHIHTPSGSWSEQSYSLADKLIIPAGHIYVLYVDNSFDTISAHTYASETAVEPSCKLPGKTAKEYCKFCDYVRIKSEEIPKLDHTFIDNGEKCNVCGENNPNYVPPTKEEDKNVIGGVQYETNKNGEYIGVKLKKPSIKKLTRKKKSFVIKWKKVAGVKGYQVQYSTSKKFKKKATKTKVYKGNKKFTKTIKKLKGKKTYYVRIRTFKTATINGKSAVVYSNWSKTKKVKTK